ncbi:hypothetical protein CCO03_07505 [Comamonas serinivorans]|uniref:IPTL-CTERM protein sorting domain-containing protein n=1 Tax=Comamonas serinivorans TaxID=1082851 RepID=A0A1Y0ELL7_9BURK|nr:IPTL-CTERM sorting domain-containing protein [Comamonas serinivorans]ARU04544.1 hypothetical protein CCO03_07505 [Comamonas serinivorans]
MRKTLLGLSAALAMAAPSLSMAAFVSGPVVYNFNFIYSGTSTGLTYDADGAPYSDLPVLLICIDHETDPPFTYDIPAAQFDTEAGARAIKGGSGAAGEAAIYWLMDQYYESYYKNGSGEQRRALQHALWELGNDYDGTAASIDPSAGKARPALEDVTEYVLIPGTTQAAFVTAYTTLYDAMRATLPTLRTTYRSGTYTMDLFSNRDPEYQHMVALIERTPANTPPLADPSITGTPQIGKTVTGSYEYADNHADPENPSGTTYRFVTSPNPDITSSSQGTVVDSGSTGGDDQTVSYTVQPTDVNQYLYYCVTPDAQTGPTPGLEVCTAAAGPVASLPPKAVPSLNQWSLMALMSLLAAMGLTRIRRPRKA